MLPIEPLGEMSSNPRQPVAWQPQWMPQTPLSAQESVIPVAVAETGSAEHESQRQAPDGQPAGQGAQDDVKLLLAGAAKEQKDATYSPKSLKAPATHGQLQSRLHAESKEDEDLLRRLKQRDQEVRMHEQAHAAALGPYAGPIQYHYQVGPDGRAYAIGGSTEVDMSRESNPAADFLKAQTIAKAAISAGDPSHADISVAAQALDQARDAAQKILTE